MNRQTMDPTKPPPPLRPQPPSSPPEPPPGPSEPSSRRPVPLGSPPKFVPTKPPPGISWPPAPPESGLRAGPAGFPPMPAPPAEANGERLSLVLTAIAGFCILVVGGIALYFTWKNYTEFRGAPLIAPPTAVPFPTPSPTPTPHVHPEGFSITPPLGWVVGTANDPTVKAGYLNPVADAEGEASVAAFVTVMVRNTPSTSLDVAVRRARRDFSTLPQFTLIDDAQTQTARGEPAHILGGTYRQKSSADQVEFQTFRSKSLILVKEGKTYLVTGTALASAWEQRQYNALFDDVLTSLVVSSPLPVPMARP